MKKLFLITLLAVFTLACENDCTQEAKCTLLSTQNHGKQTKTEAKVKVCHEGKTIEVNANALQAHLNHGDTEGECETLSTNGLEFKDGEVVEIDCKYDIPFIYTTENGTQWLYSKVSTIF